MSKLGDLTPEKPIMNDSGVEFISPQTTAIHTSSLSSSSANGSAYSTPNSLSTTGYSSVYSTTGQYTSLSSEAEKSEKNNEKVAEKSDLISDDEGDSDEEESEEEDSKSENKENESSENKKDGLPNKPPKPYLEIIADAILSCSVSCRVDN